MLSRIRSFREFAGDAASMGLPVGAFHSRPAFLGAGGGEILANGADLTI
jgi:hypothetical protein